MQLHRIRPVIEHDGRFVTLHLDVGRASEDAVKQRQARWTTIRHDLEESGCPAALVEDLQGRLEENTHVSGEARRTIVAGAQEVLLDEVQPGHSTWPECVDHGALPHVARRAHVLGHAFASVVSPAGADQHPRSPLRQS